jgi:hypothetical protein
VDVDVDVDVDVEEVAPSFKGSLLLNSTMMKMMKELTFMDPSLPSAGLEKKRMMKRRSSSGVPVNKVVMLDSNWQSLNKFLRRKVNGVHPPLRHQYQTGQV